jgi:hypothetical protein
LWRQHLSEYGWFGEANIWALCLHLRSL